MGAETFEISATDQLRKLREEAQTSGESWKRCMVSVQSGGGVLDKLKSDIDCRCTTWTYPLISTFISLNCKLYSQVKTTFYNSSTWISLEKCWTRLEQSRTVPLLRRVALRRVTLLNFSNSRLAVQALHAYRVWLIDRLYHVLHQKPLILEQ